MKLFDAETINPRKGYGDRAPDCCGLGQDLSEDGEIPMAYQESVLGIV